MKCHRSSRLKCHFVHWHGILALVALSSIVYGQYSQQFLREPTDSQAVVGSTNIFYCKVDNLQSRVQWTRNGFGLGTGRDLPGYPRYTIIGATELGEYDLMVANAQLEDDAEFQCQVMATESTPPLTSRIAKLTILAPPDQPHIDGTPVISVVVDTPYDIVCHADNGKPAANVTWSSNGEEITDNVSYSFTTKPDGKRQDAIGTLMITPQKSDQARSIRCDVRNSAMNFPKWTEAHLEVLYPPTVTMRLPASKKVKEFSSMRFTCNAVGNPNEITWKWFKGDDEVAAATTNVLNIEVMPRELHGKDIVCEATNSVGSTRQHQTLNVEYGPQFMSKSTYVAADVGDTATLTCQVDSNPPPAIIWTRSHSPRRILSSSNIFSLMDVARGDFGSYTCMASVIGFEEITMDVRLLEKGAPRIVSVAKQYAKFGDLGMVECSIDSVPDPTSIVWTRDGEPLEWANLDRYELSTEDLSPGKRSVIHIQSVQAGDFGIYNCSVQNGYGQDFKTITFYKQEVVAMAYILAGVLTGILIIIAVAVAVFLYQRRKSLNSESGSESSASSIGKKKDGLDVPMDYKNDHFGNPVEAWRQDCDPRYYRHSAEYDELSYPPKDAHVVNPDYPDGFGNYGYSTGYPQRDYGTYPGPNKMYAGPRYEPGYAASYTSDPYRTYPAPPRSDYEPTLDVTRLSTNV